MYVMSTAERAEPFAFPAPPTAALEPTSFSELYRAEHAKLLRLGYALTGSRAVAEELVQETMLRVLGHWHRVAELEQPGAWARRILMNLATSRARRLTVEARIMLRLRGDRMHEPAPSPDAAALWDAVRALPKHEAQAIALFYVEDMTVAQIATVLQAPEPTVKSWLQRARARLATRLGDEA
jgi:RNA polymerase sigma-70 factor (ECF subfamily)